jgi:hypothetical protein
LALELFRLLWLLAQALLALNRLLALGSWLLALGLGSWLLALNLLALAENLVALLALGSWLLNLSSWLWLLFWLLALGS